MENQCSDTDFCPTFAKRLQLEKSGGVKGFVLAKAEILYSQGRRDKGVALLFCPFCGFRFRKQ